MKRTFFFIPLVIIFSIVLTACGFGKVTPFPTPTAKAVVETPSVVISPSATQTPVEQNEGPIQILSSNLYTDGFGDVHVAALVSNKSDQALEFVTFAIEIRDANGKTMIFDDSKNPVESTEVETLLSILAPHSTSPLDYYIVPAEGSTAKDYKITYVSSEATTSSAVPLTLENTHYAYDDDGVYYLFGELVNKNSQAVKISGLAGTVVDGNGKFIAAASTMNMVEYLAPASDPDERDRVPFGISIYAPEGGDYQYGNIYPYAEPSETLSARGIQLSIESNYVDSQGNFHIIGIVKHTDPSQLTFPIQGTVTDSSGAVLDTSFTMLPLT